MTVVFMVKVTAIVAKLLAHFTKVLDVWWLTSFIIIIIELQWPQVMR